jgi:polysaccharide export outer membrane protein
MKILRYFLLLVFPLYLISCGGQQKIPRYLQYATDSTIKEEVIIQELRIQKNDLLSIQIYSESTDPATDAAYNLETADGSTGASGGFLVNTKGEIEYPKLGTFHAEGLTKEELAAQIKKKLIEPKELLVNPVVVIRFLNLRVTVMGEVNSQGVINFPGEKVTILEAIGLAGGVTNFGIKNAVRVVREVDGKREMGLVDLSSEKLFESPYYNLQQNDVVFVDPIGRKAQQADQTFVMQRISFTLSILTALTLIYNIFLR